MKDVRRAAVFAAGSALSVLVLTACTDQPGDGSSDRPETLASTAAGSPTTSPAASPSGVPTPSHRPTAEPPPARPADVRGRTAVQAVRHLAGRIGPRQATGRAYRRAARWVTARMRQRGLQVRTQPFRVPGGTAIPLLAVLLCLWLLAHGTWREAAWVAAALLLILSSGITDGAGAGVTLRSVIGIVVLVLILGGLVYFGWQVLRWQNEEFVVTSRRVLQTEGVLNKRVVDSSLEKINDAILSESIFGRIFGFGDLEVLTASETGISRLRMLRQADDFKRAMLDAKQNYQRGFGYLDPQPLGAYTPAAEPPLAPYGDLENTLRKLADLRDQGLLSQAEFEAKKRELLSRI